MDELTLPEKWKLLFNSLLQSNSPDANFNVDVANEEIIFVTPDHTVATSLTAILNSPEAARASLSYSLTEEKQINITSLLKKDYPQPIQLQHDQGIAIFERIFGDAIIQRTGKMPWHAVDLKSENNHIAYFTCEKQYNKLSRHQVDTYKDILSSASFDELRRAIALDDAQHAEVPLNLDQKGMLAKHIDKILHIRSAGDIDTIYFDYGLLIKCLTAPAMEVTETAELQFKIHMNKNHLINYLNIIFQEGFVLRITGKEGEQEALPICFDTKGSIPVDNVVSLILDISKSMESGFNAYINNVCQFIKKLSEKENFLHARLRLIPFNEKFSVAEYFISNKEEDLEKIYKYLKDQKADGSTFIYHVLQVELNELAKLADKNNITVLTFTDGGDNDDEVNRYKHKASLDKVLKLMSTSSHPAKIYAVGLGDNFTEQNLLDLEAASHGKFIKLNSIDEDFAPIYAHLDTMGQSRLLARFVQDLSNTEFTVQVYADAISVASQALKFPMPFHVGDNRYAVQPGGLPLLESPEAKQDDTISDAATMELEELDLQIQRQKQELDRLIANSNKQKADVRRMAYANQQRLFANTATNSTTSSASLDPVTTPTLH